ncbi:MAG: hypothetical protein JO297_15450 [Nitrososphaeraceae archaeon]|nr:hypothetical protein [Nitrososphaeraceae archaeon]
MNSDRVLPSKLFETAEGRIKWKENIFEGLENASKAFISLFKGESLGRTLENLGLYNE